MLQNTHEMREDFSSVTIDDKNYPSYEKYL